MCAVNSGTGLLLIEQPQRPRKPAPGAAFRPPRPQVVAVAAKGAERMVRRHGGGRKTGVGVPHLEATVRSGTKPINPEKVDAAVTRFAQTRPVAGQTSRPRPR